MNWGKSIIIAFACFAGVIASLVTISMKQDVNLVADDYYKQELAYQDQIDRKDNYNKLEDKPVVLLDASGNFIDVQFPPELIKRWNSGQIHMFRPSTSKWDKKYEIALDQSGKQRIDITALPGGVWKAKINWKSDNEEYYTEMILTK